MRAECLATTLLIVTFSISDAWSADISFEIETSSTIGVSAPVSWAFVPVALLTSSCPSVDVLGFNVAADFSSGSTNGSLDFDFSLANFISSTPTILTNGVGAALGTPSVGVCNTNTERILHTEAALSLTSIAVGSFGSTALNSQEASAVVSYSDTINIFSPIATTIELPVTLQADGVAGESFGTANTEATVEASFTGDVLGTNINGGGFSLVSVTTIPETGSISQTERVAFPVNPGNNSFQFNVAGDFRISATAESTAFITSAATSGLTLPNSFEIDFFTGPGGSPIPPGVTITSTEDGTVYHVPEPSSQLTLLIGMIFILRRSISRSRNVVSDW